MGGTRSIFHYSDVKMGTMASLITSLTIVYSTVYSGADQRKHQSSASLAFVWEIHRWPMNSPHKWPVTRKMFPFDDVIMYFFMLLTVTQQWRRVSPRGLNICIISTFSATARKDSVLMYGLWATGRKDSVLMYGFWATGRKDSVLMYGSWANWNEILP